MSSGPRSRAEYLPEMGGERLDALVVPGGRVELRLRWAIRYVPTEPEAEEVLMTSNPILPLGHDEEQRLRSRATWLSEFVEEEREIRARQAERGEYPTQRERQVFYRLDEALDYINELQATSHQARQAQGVSLMRMAVTPSTSENVEEILSGLTKPLEVVHNVELQEVKRNLQRWIPSLEKEMETLTKSGTLIPIPLPMAKEKAAAGEIVLVPAKTVHTAKPPGQDEGLYKRRSRIVICGNFIGGGDVDVYTAAASAESVRCALTVGAKKGWCGAVTDVNSAFTLTPMTESTVKYAITIPKVVVDAGCAPTNTAYMVDRVLYGLREAPRLWGSYRDRRVTRARFKVGNKLCMFIQMETDPSVWRVVEVGKESNTVALMVIYVDDVMMLGPMEYVEAMYQWLTVGSEDDKGWKCSPLEWLGKEPVRYLGMDVRRKEAENLVSYHISQGSYVTELLKAYRQEASRPSHVPATKDVMPFNEESVALSEPSEERVREAQKMAGELLWLVTRTRPDVGYSTAHVCAAATRNPEGAIRLAKLTMRYLAATPDLGLRYDGGGDPVVAYSDASFAPQGDRSFGCVTTATYGGFTAWRMTKQPTVVLSAAEAELVELLNARQQAAGLQAWLEEVVPDERGTPTLLCVDNTAAGGLATTSPGSWKTRHLKVKASHLRLETSEGRIQVVHTPGERQVADMGTKPVPGPRLQVLRRLWGMCTAEEFDKDEHEVIVASLSGPDYYDLVRMFVWLMLVSRIPKGEAAEYYNKKPLEYDGSFEFYGLMLIAGIALLGVWELLKWVMQKILGEDPGAVARAKRLLRIRNQASKALQEELASMSSSSSDPICVDKGTRLEPGMSTTRLASQATGSDDVAVAPAQPPTTTNISARSTLRHEDDPDLREAMMMARNGDYRRLRTAFVMSEHGDRLHLVEGCHGLRHANRAQLRRLQLCYFCDGHYPLSYRVTEGRTIPEG